jgi:hypothetical protein
MTRIALLSAVILAATGTAAFAHSNDARFSEQSRWIEQGRRTGDITWTEGIKLRKEQAELRRVENSMKSDGRFTLSEKRRLHRLQNRAANHIAEERTDGWHRVWWLPRVGR